jgi:hypothetical protein
MMSKMTHEEAITTKAVGHDENALKLSYEKNAVD